jgi:phosphoribosylanthranilate isomerase
MSLVRVKICGLMSIEDAQYANDAGADYLGLIFVPGTPRVLTVEKARAIMDGVKLSQNTRWVGVFQNQSLTDVQVILSQLELDFVQMHSPTDELFRAALSVPTFQAQTLDVNQFLAPAATGAVLLEPPKGSGVTLLDWIQKAGLEDWHKLHTFNEGFPLLLAGGLNSDNINECLSTLRKKDCAPFAMDVASGVESSPGKKDAAKVGAFCRIVHACPTNFSGLFSGDLY